MSTGVGEIPYCLRVTDQPTDSRVRAYQTLTGRESERTEAIRASEQGFVEVIERVIGRWRGWWWTQRRDTQPVEINRQLNLKFRLCFPLAAHALNHVDCAWALHQSLPWIAASGARVAFEHALTAQWVLLTEGGEVQLKSQMDRAAFVRRERYVSGVRQISDRDHSFAAALGLTDDELVALVGERPLGDRSNFEQLCLRFASKEVADLFYDVSRSLSEAVHPSYGLIRSYLTFDTDWNVRGLDCKGTSGESSELLRSLAVSGLWALFVLEVCRDGQPNVQEVLEIGGRAGLPVDLRASDQHPEWQPVSDRYW